MASWLLPAGNENDNSDDIRNPKVDQDDRAYEDGQNGEGARDAEDLEISKKTFDELTSVFPNPIMSTDTILLNEIHELKKMVQDLQKKIG